MARKLIGLLLGGLLCSPPVAAAWADGAVYTMENILGNNDVLVYHRALDGTLSVVQIITTGGGGSGVQVSESDPLGSAGAVQLDPDHHLLFVVNTESANYNDGNGAYHQDCNQGSITSFVVGSDGKLTFADRVFSGGLFPNSLTIKKVGKPVHVFGHLIQTLTNPSNTASAYVLYALNAGGPGIPACQITPSISGKPNISGFTVDTHGIMTPVGTVQASAQAIDPGPPIGNNAETCSSASAAGFATLTFTSGVDNFLGAPAADFQCGLNPPSFARSPGQVKFTPNGQQLVVSVKGTSTIYVFPVGDDGRVGNPTVTQAPGPALPSYLGMTFDQQGHLLITELYGTATSIPKVGSGAVSSFTITRAGHLIPISQSISNGGTASGWITLDRATGKFAYVANNSLSGISSYTVGNDGSVTLLAAMAAPGFRFFSDLAVAAEGAGNYIYGHDSVDGQIGVFKVNSDGSLIPHTAFGTTGGQGLAAY